MFELIGDKKELYQWDRDRRITIPKGVTKVRFSNLTHGVSTDRTVIGEEMEIPPELLRIHGDLFVWGGDENNTDYSKHFNVIKSPKPADYIHTPEELKTWEELKKQIGNLENLNTEAKDNLVDAINELLLNGGGGGSGENGVGIEKIEQTTKSTEDNGENIIAVTLTNSQKYTFSVFNGSKGSKGDKGDKGEQGAKGENGKSAFEYAVEGGYLGDETQFGKDLSQVQNKITSPETAEIGQTIVVKSVNDAMQPTEWECANLPTGGGEQVDVFTVVAEGGEMFIGFTLEELGMRDIFDCKALQFWAHNLGYSSETLTGAQKVTLKSNNGTYFYGAMITPSKECATLENADSNQFTTSKIDIPVRYEEHIKTGRRKELPIGVVSSWNVDSSALGMDYCILSPTQYNNGLYIWINQDAVWTAGSTFHVKIWR